jgi:hypothetical protein
MIQFKELLIFMLLSLSTGTFAQSTRQDALYLTNGSIIRGKVLESTEGKFTKIETVGQNVLVFPGDEILKIVFNEELPVNNASAPASPVEVLSNFEFHGGNSSNSGGFNVIPTFHFASGMSTGLGFGFEIFDISLVPVFADIRYYLLKKSRTTPYIYTQAGYAIAMSGGEKNTNDYMRTSYKGGLLAGGGIGIRCNLGTGNALVFGLGYRFQKTTKETVNLNYYGVGQDLTNEKIEKLNRISVSAGFLFN